MADHMPESLAQIAYEAFHRADFRPAWEHVDQPERERWEQVSAAICIAAAPMMTATINDLRAELSAARQAAEMSATSGAFWAKRAETAERRLKEDNHG